MARVSDTVALTPSLVVTYNEAVVPVTDTWALAVRYVPLWSSGTPSLEEWRAYTATVAGAMDAAAQAVTATWTFTTGDFTQPEVVGTSPEKDYQGEAPERLTAYFNEDVSTTGATFTLRGPYGEVDGSLVYGYDNDERCKPEDPSCFQWHFTPYDPLTPGQYTAEVFGVTDRAGLEMEAPYAWSFEVTEESGGELLVPPAEAPQAEEGGEPAAEAGPAAVPETVEPEAEEEPLAAPAGDGGEIESGLAGVLYVRRTSYYYFGSQRVAMRQTGSWGENVVYYLVTDHLGTTSLMLCGNVNGCDGVPNGGRVAESRHYPYGAVRWTWTADGSGTLPTDYRFTGQRDDGLGLTHMGARFLDSALGRWTSADTIVPEPGNPQSLNRYSWVLNQPLRYVDPTGHKEDGECGPNDNCQEPPEWWVQLMSDPEFRAWLAAQVDNWLWDHVPSAYGPYADFSISLGCFFEGELSGEVSLMFNWRSGEVTFLYGPGAGVYAGTPRGGSISGTGGAKLVFGASENRYLQGVNAYLGAVLEGDAIGELGVKAVGSTGLDNDDVNGDGKLDLEDRVTLFVDPNSNKHVNSLQVGATAGVNAVPNGLEGGVVGGATVTAGFNIVPGWNSRYWIWNWW